MYAAQLSEQHAGSDAEPIEAVFRVIDPKIDDSGPMLDENGNPPFGKMGELDRNDDGTQYHICGCRFRSAVRHLLSKHYMTTEENDGK